MTGCKGEARVADLPWQVMANGLMESILTPLSSAELYAGSYYLQLWARSGVYQARRSTPSRPTMGQGACSMDGFGVCAVDLLGQEFRPNFRWYETPRLVPVGRPGFQAAPSVAR